MFSVYCNCNFLLEKFDYACSCTFLALISTTKGSNLTSTGMRVKFVLSASSVAPQIHLHTDFYTFSTTLNAVENEVNRKYQFDLPAIVVFVPLASVMKVVLADDPFVTSDISMVSFLASKAVPPGWRMVYKNSGIMGTAIEN